MTAAAPSPLVHRAGHFRPIFKLALLVVAVVLVGSVIKSVVSPGPPAPCASPCVSPPAGANLPTAATFSSPKYGFSFEYPEGASRVAVTGDEVIGLQYSLKSGGFGGEALIGATSSTTSAQQLIDQQSGNLGSEGITNLQPGGGLDGAEIGFIAGTGESFTGVYTDPVGNHDPVNIGIIAVPHGTNIVYFLGISVAASDHSTPPAYAAFDSILDHWTWSNS